LEDRDDPPGKLLGQCALHQVDGGVDVIVVEDDMKFPRPRVEFARPAQEPQEQVIALRAVSDQSTCPPCESAGLPSDSVLVLPRCADSLLGPGPHPIPSRPTGEWGECSPRVWL